MLYFGKRVSSKSISEMCVRCYFYFISKEDSGFTVIMQYISETLSRQNLSYKLFRSFAHDVVLLPVTQIKSSCCWHHLLQGTKDRNDFFLKNIKNYPTIEKLPEFYSQGKYMCDVLLRFPLQVFSLWW